MPERTEQRQGGGAAAGETDWQAKLWQAGQAVLLFFVTQMIVSQVFGKGSSNTSKATTSTGQTMPAFTGIPAYNDRPLAPVEVKTPIPQSIAPIWPTNSSLDIIIYVADSIVMPALRKVDKSTVVLEELDFRMGNWSDSRVINTTFAVPRGAQKNGTLYAHFYVALHGKAFDPTSSDYDPGSAYHYIRPLSQILPKKRVRKTKNLLKGSDDEDEVVDEGPKYTFSSYYHPNFTMSIIPDSGILQYPTMHPAVRQHLQLEATGARDESGYHGWYYPVLFVNAFWQLRDHMTELNSTVKTLPLHITLNNMNNWKFSLYASIDEGTKQTQRQAASGGPMPAGGDGSEFEMFKQVLVDTNVWLLATTGIVSVLHMIFEALAFKSDISHWRKKKDNVGISVRTILANVFMQTIIFLYLMDNSDGTSWMILIGQGMGILIEAWKITKVVDVRIREAAPGALIPYKVTFEDKGALSETEKKTQEYDEIAFQYLFYVAIPLLGAYAVYSLIYDTHKSWYSFVITTLVGSVYAYGFLMMVPSLYINYRLKSVAHMPAKAMTYKFLNTFIDDLFAFTIKMPTLHRLATLRDDVIFFVYIYQSYAYKVDHTRVNEFGQGGEDDDVAEEKEAADKASVAGLLDEGARSGEERMKDSKQAKSASGSQKASGSAKKRR